MGVKTGVLDGDDGLNETGRKPIDGDEVTGGDAFIDGVGKEDQPPETLEW